MSNITITRLLALAGTLAVVAFLGARFGIAQTPDVVDPEPQVAEASVVVDVPATLAATLPGIDATDIMPTPVAGLYEIQKDAKIVYITEDGEYLIQGQIIHMQSSENVTEQRLAIARGQELSKLTKSDMVVFSPKGKPKHSVTVFTDIDCGYCRKLHREMDGYLEAGIEVKYLFFPRSGPNTDSWAKAESVWCAKNQRSAMTRAKNGESLPAASCETPIQKHYQMGAMIGLRGTPAIVLPDGELLPGYLTAKDLAARLN